MLNMVSGLSLERARCSFQARLHEKQSLTLGRVAETRVTATTSKCQEPEKVWGSSLLLFSCLLALSLLCTCQSNLHDVKKSGKVPWPSSCISSLFSSYLHRTHIPEPLAIGHWTASLSVSLLNVNTTREGAKTKVLLREIHCVNILAGELYKGRGGHSLDYLLTKEAPYKGVI